MGRPPLPTATHEARGSYKVHPERRRPAEPKPGGRPTKPAHLTGIAGKEWKRITGFLEHMKVLSRVEAAALEQYCRAYQEWRECCQTIDKEGAVIVETRGTGNNTYDVLKTHPIDKRKQYLSALILRYLTEFGLTPSSRSRVQVPDGGQHDSLLEMLGARNN
jgi:P27 family predicted phage terminase small subunit